MEKLNIKLKPVVKNLDSPDKREKSEVDSNTPSNSDSK